MRLTDLLDRPVVSRAEATELGRVEQVVVHAAEHRITALVLRDGAVVPVAVATIGPDAVVVDGASVLVDGPGVHDGAGGAEVAGTGGPGGAGADRPPGAGQPTLLGARALGDSGDQLGTVTDLEVDEVDGTIRTVVLDEVEVGGDRLLGVGDYAVVLAEGVRRNSPKATRG